MYIEEMREKGAGSLNRTWFGGCCVASQLASRARGEGRKEGELTGRVYLTPYKINQYLKISISQSRCISNRSNMVRNQKVPRTLNSIKPQLIFFTRPIHELHTRRM